MPRAAPETIRSFFLRAAHAAARALICPFLRSVAVGVTALLLALALVPSISTAAPNLATPAPKHAVSTSLPIIDLQAGGARVTAERADTERTRRQGLMGRKTLAENHGMLFVFDRPDVYCFWMKNTPLPLSIAFIDAQGQIVSIQDMEPHSLAPHCPPRAVTQALEMAQGWFGRAGVKAGEKVHAIDAQTRVP